MYTQPREGGHSKWWVGPLSLSIGLRMKSQRQTNGSTQHKQTCEMNWGPRSETMSDGIPWSRNTWPTKRSAVSLAEGSLWRGTKWTDLEKQSTMVRITELPREGGRLE